MLPAAKQGGLGRGGFLLSIGAIVLGAISLLFFVPGTHVRVEDLPAELSDRDFWQLVTEFSEPGGFFRSDNFVSNESTFQHKIPELTRRTRPGGVYVGVGPDQNFTYIVAMKPKLAFIVDIRRQNLLQHLMYKAIIEQSANRAEFLSTLFSRPLTRELPDDVALEEIFQELHTAESPASTFEQNLQGIVGRLTEKHAFALSHEDVSVIEYIYRAFRTAGPEIRYSYPSQWGWRRFPSYSELMLESDEEGTNHSYLATEENFQFLKKLETENRIVPLVGDFAGTKALTSLSRYLKDHGASVSAFYTSNVEFYLFQSEDWRRFFANIAGFPLSEQSTFIRAYFNNYGFRFPNQTSGARSVTLLDNMQGLVEAFDDGDIRTYYDIIERSR
jgi:hypothetical protein